MLALILCLGLVILWLRLHLERLKGRLRERLKRLLKEQLKPPLKEPLKQRLKGRRVLPLKALPLLQAR
jgi:hypothetical protein